MTYSTCARLAALVLAALLTYAPHASAQGSASPAAPPLSLSHGDARIIIDAAIAYARDTAKSRMAVVVLDNAGHLIAADRMDGASFHLAEFAHGKAYLAAVTRQNTQNAADMAKVRPDRYFGIMNMFSGKVYMVGGGLPIAADGKLVGAIGIAGLAEGVDEAAGKAGIAAWEKARKR